VLNVPMCFMCLINVLHTCASCALYAHGRIVGLLGLVFFSIVMCLNPHEEKHNVASLGMIAVIRRMPAEEALKLREPWNQLQGS